jgi:AraC-like DNA-binding protein
VRTLLENLKKVVHFDSGLVISVVPRGGLQIVQPSHVSDALIKSYARGFSNEDRLTWQTIVKRKPLRLSDAYRRGDVEQTPYYKELLEPANLKYALALPLSGPVLAGYPGAVHVFRSDAEHDFTAKEIEALMNAVRQFDAKKKGSREASKERTRDAKNGIDNDSISFAVLDGKMKPLLNGSSFTALDNRLREQVLEHAKRRLHQMNGHLSAADRVQLPDSHGDVTVYRVIVFKKFPALGDGSYTLLCRQPGCVDWGSLKPQDFQADAELSRLIPALKFMQQEYSRGPTLNEIADQVHLSPFHFHRRFTELLGLTPKQFLLECQIHQTKTDLLSGDKDLAQIARDCGFAHQSHFTSRFKQTTGLTPTRWRRMMSEKVSSN